MAEKVVVLGSNSFSGAHFVDHLLGEGSDVVGLSRSAEPIRPFLPYKDNANAERFKFIQADLNHDLAKIMAVVSDFKPDFIVNFSAQSMVAESWLHPEHWFQTNVLSQVQLHDQLRRLPFLKKYVHVSTPEVYGSCEGNVTETAPYNPSTPYAASRAAADMSLMTFFKNYKFPVVFTRAANVYGPGQQLYRIIPRALLFGRLGKKLQLHGGGTSVRSFIHIRDVARGTAQAMRAGTPGEIFHFSTNLQISIRELVALLANRLGVPFETLAQDVGERAGKDAAYLLDSAKAHRSLDWKDRISLEDGVAETLQWVDHHLDELKTQNMNYEHKA